MNLCFIIYSWFPYGGQQRDFLRVLQECMGRGHRIRVLTLKWEGPRPEDVEIAVAPVRSLTRHGLYRRFSQWVDETLSGAAFDLVVGFNKMPGLDVYYAADPCFAEKALTQRGWYYRFTPRYRHFLAWEEAVFGAGSRTRALLLSPQQREDFTRHYPGCEPRLFDLPPGISRDRMAPANAPQIRAALRAEFSIQDHQHLVLQIGSGFRVKGVDRSLRAIAALPPGLRADTVFILVGQDKSAAFERLAQSLGIRQQCIFLPGREDIPSFLLGADLMLHPAYSESAGYVLLEATVAGLPVLTTDTCGYAFHILQARSGQVCASPFSQQDLNQRLVDMLTSPQRRQWQDNGLRYGREHDLYSMPQSAADRIEQFARQRQQGLLEVQSAKREAVPAARRSRP